MDARLQRLNETITVSSATTYQSDGHTDQPPVPGQHGNIVPANKDFYAPGRADIPDIIGGTKRRRKPRKKKPQKQARRKARA